MARIAFLLLAHKDPDAVVAQAERLTATGDHVAIHFDASAPKGTFRRIHAALRDNPGVAFARRVRCGWGEWSLVQATLNACEAALEAFPGATHFYMLSGDCMPIKSARYARAFLDREDADLIESFDYFESDWIKTGFKEERLVYRHWFNERTQKRRFYAAFALQRRLGITRAVPADLRMMIGSQWWCLRRATLERVMAFRARRPDVMRFFRTTWIPDETFFQTLVRHLVREEEIRPRTPTFLMFSDYGMPVTFYNDQYDLLLSQDFLFARKISPEAMDLKARLGDLWAEERTDFPLSDEGRRLHAFLTSRGRVGRRFAPRFWEREATLGRGRELLLVTCKKWHVAKRLTARIREEAGLPCIDYLFDEEATPLPDLGGIETTLEKRQRHRRAVLRMLFERHGTDRLVICLDPARLDLMQDFQDDRCVTRLLEMECAFTDDYLAGHARRVGLAGEATADETIGRLLPTIRQEIADEGDRIRDAGFAHLHRLRETATDAGNAAELAAFLRCGEDVAGRIVDTRYLFED
ncbi:core-2/I-Branching enzyme [Hasllibacter halocynthiae]|uniref:Peptide O-xylosyltransferase n=1 Tax=Hasllibacter halocynthiae TaxID=595589 RepID=A0A2T0X1D2_9RHOB|nr:DUF5928 domain-containing protein [Hasllibacter halocynthiae]PRY92740.1 core-2/I-Branching enzyme [Hasllibacter halocynthiae]